MDIDGFRADAICRELMLLRPDKDLSKMKEGARECRFLLTVAESSAILLFELSAGACSAPLQA